MRVKFKLHHFTILCEDLAQSTAFYCDMLGNQLVARRPAGQQPPAVFVGNGSDALIELLGPPFQPEQQAFIEKRAYGIYQLGFQVDDLEAAYRQLKEGGVAVVEAPHEVDGRKYCAFVDPDGVRLEVFQPARDGAETLPTIDPSAGLRLHHIDLLSDDWQRSLRFYEDHFGLRSVLEYLDDSGGAFLFLADAFFDSERHNFLLEIIGPPYDEEREHVFYAKYGTGLDHLAYVAEDVPARWKEALERGARNMVDPYQDYGIDIAWVKDPGGNDVEIMNPIPDHIIETARESGKAYRLIDTL